MRIVYCGCFRLPNFDAAAPRVLNNAKIFREAGHTVQFISWGGRYRKTDLCSDGKYRVDGFEYVITDELDTVGGFFIKLKAKLQRGRKSLQLLENMRLKPDLVVMYNADYWWTKTMIRYCRERRIKLCNDITEWYDNNELHLTEVIPNAINMKWLQRKVPNKIVISSMLQRYYAESNTLRLPPLCDPSEKKWSATVEDDRVRPFEGITLIYAGKPAKKDCVHSVINAVNTLANEGKSIRFLILGTTRDSYIKQYRQSLHSVSLNENILFLGRVSQDLIPAYYKKADFMVLLREPNRKSMAGFPTKFAESITSGVPVITNATSDLKQYVVNRTTGFLVSGYDYESILATLRWSVLPMCKEDLERMKCSVRYSQSSFAWCSYVTDFKKFCANIR